MSQQTYSEALKEAIAIAKRKVNLLDYANQKLGLEMRGKTGTCPFCGEKGKFGINPVKGLAGCFRTGCGSRKGMDHIGLHMEIKGVDYREACHALLSFAGVEHPWDKFQRERSQRKGNF